MLSIDDKISEVSSKLPPWLASEIRSDHAGETGAIWIYCGILAITCDSEVRDFAERHIETEMKHLELLEGWLDEPDRSSLLPLWKIAGFITGALPALFGATPIYATVEAVETFVVRHYEAQITILSELKEHEQLCNILVHCCQDEVAHGFEAHSLKRNSLSILLRTWCHMIDIGSGLAVNIARRI